VERGVVLLKFYRLALAALVCVGCGEAGSPSGHREQSALGGAFSLSPNTDLVDGQEVTLTVTGVADGTLAIARICNVEGLAPPPLHPDFCASPLSFGVFAPVNGTISKTFPAPASIEGINCQIEDCALYVEGGDLLNAPTFTLQGLMPMSFRSIGEPALAPPITVTPSTGLADRQLVAVKGSGFLPNIFVTLAQCRTGATSVLADCGFWSNLARTGAAGEVDVIAEVRYEVQPTTGAAFRCEPGACTFIVVPSRREIDLNEAGRAPIEFDFDVNPGPVQRGSLDAGSETVISGQAVQVQGSGWAAGADVRVAYCAGVGAYPCVAESSVRVGADGTFAIPVPTASLIRSSDLGTAVYLHHCLDWTGACGVRAYDARDLDATRVVLPLTVLPVPGVSATLDAQSPLIPDMAVRLTGSGFAPNRPVDVWQCGGGAAASGCAPRGSFRTDASGQLRAYPSFLSQFSVFTSNDITIDCGPSASPPCTLRFTDGAALVTLPLSFAVGEEFAIASNYEPEWQPLLQQGMTLSGWSAPELQLHGALSLLYVMSSAGATSSTHLPASGTLSYTTTYSRPLYQQMANLAAARDYTVPELQKAGALFTAWVLAGRPPLPQTR